MSASHRRRAASRSPLQRLAIWGLPGALLLAVVLFFAGRLWVEKYLRSPAFQQLVAARIGQTLKAETELQKLNYAELTLHSDGLRARGSEGAAFAHLQLEQMRAELSLRRFFERAWQVDRLEVQRLAVQLDGSRVSLPPPPAPATRRQPGLLSSWIPNRVEIASTRIREANFTWGTPAAHAPESPRGRLSGTSLEIGPQDGGWSIVGLGGTLAQEGYPTLDVGEVRLRYRAPTLFVQSADLRHGVRGTLRLNGEVHRKESVDLHVKLEQIEVTPLLPPDWRVRLHGQLAGEVDIRSSLPANGSPSLTGSLRLVDGQLEALPLLDEIALFTRMQQFRRLALSTATAEFRRDGDRLRVTNFAAESRGLIRLEGSFDVIGVAIDGNFQVGITPAALQWLPGSQERVFTASRGGYLWAPMRITGTLEKPQEDLSARLVAAAGGAVIQEVEKTGREVLETGKDAAKGVLDLLNPLFR